MNLLPMGLVGPGKDKGWQWRFWCPRGLRGERGARLSEGYEEKYSVSEMLSDETTGEHHHIIRMVAIPPSPIRLDREAERRERAKWKYDKVVFKVAQSELLDWKPWPRMPVYPVDEFLFSDKPEFNSAEKLKERLVGGKLLPDLKDGYEWRFWSDDEQAFLEWVEERQDKRKRWFYRLRGRDEASTDILKLTDILIPEPPSADSGTGKTYIIHLAPMRVESRHTPRHEPLPPLQPTKSPLRGAAGLRQPNKQTPVKEQGRAFARRRGGPKMHPRGDRFEWDRKATGAGAPTGEGGVFKYKGRIGVEARDMWEGEERKRLAKERAEGVAVRRQWERDDEDLWQREGRWLTTAAKEARREAYMTRGTPRPPA